MNTASLFYKLRRAAGLYADLYLRRRRPVLIFSTGRVGSMALYYALAARGAFVIQTHTFDPARVGGVSRSEKWAYNHIIRPGRPASLICLARDPMALLVSDFFGKLRWVAGRPDAAEHLDTDELCALFNTAYFEQGRHSARLNWFENEMQPALGIDIYAHPSPAADGWARFRQGVYEVLLLTTELDDSSKGRVVGDFAGLQDFSIPRANVGEQKSHGRVYRLFKQQLAVTPENIETVYSTRYARHFYTPETLQTLRERWANPALRSG